MRCCVQVVYCMLTFQSIVTFCSYYIQVVPGRAGGGSFRRQNNYIAKKEFAYRIRARRLTSAMPKPLLCCERAFCCSMVVMWHVLLQHFFVLQSTSAVLQSTTPVLLCTTKNYSSTTPYYNVLLQYYSVRQSTSPYHKVRLYYSVPQSTTPVLFHSTKYYSSIT